MAAWVVQKNSLYSLVATKQCSRNLSEMSATLLVTEATWADVDQDLPKMDPSFVSEVQILRERQHLKAVSPPQENIRAIYQRFDGQLNLRVCSLCAIADPIHGTLLIDSVPDIHALTRVRAYSYTTGVTIARGWLSEDPKALTAPEYVAQAARLMMLTPSHPEAGWWFTQLQPSD